MITLSTWPQVAMTRLQLQSLQQQLGAGAAAAVRACLSSSGGLAESEAAPQSKGERKECEEQYRAMCKAGMDLGSRLTTVYIASPQHRRAVCQGYRLLADCSSSQEQAVGHLQAGLAHSTHCLGGMHAEAVACVRELAARHMRARDFAAAAEVLAAAVRHFKEEGDKVCAVPCSHAMCSALLCAVVGAC